MMVVHPCTMKEKNTYVVIVNYNGHKDTIDCIAALVESDFPESRIIVVDNNSSDNSADRIAECYRDLCVVRSTSNLGYAAGNNLGIEMACANGAEAIMVLNNDVIVDKHTITTLEETISEHEDIGVIGPLVLEWSRKELVESAGARVMWYRGSSKPLFRGSHARQVTQAPFNVDYVSGCAMFIQRSAIERVGRFPPHFFMYCEEEDLCLRMAKENFKVMCCPNAKVWHKGGMSVSKTPGLREFMETRNRFMIMKRHAGVIQTLSFMGFWLWAETLYYAFRDIGRGRNPRITVSRIRGTASGFRRFITEERIGHG